MVEFGLKVLVITALMVGAMFAVAWGVDRAADWLVARWGRRRP